MYSPESVETVGAAVDCEDGRAGVGLGHPAVPLEDDDLGPDLIINRFPFAENLLYVILERRRRKDRGQNNVCSYCRYK